MKHIHYLLALALMALMVSTACNKDDDDDDDDNPMVTDQTIVLECDGLSEAKTLVNSSADIDYLINCNNMQVTAHIEIEPGTVIAFMENSHLIVTSGSISAIGTSNAPIVFRGEEQESGYWKGLGFDSNSSNNRLEHVVVQDAGSDYIRCCDEAASLTIFGGKFSIANTTIRNGAAYGLDLRDEAEISEYSSVRITEHGNAPVIIDIESINDLDDVSSNYTGNTNDYIEVRGREIMNPVTFSKQTVPYFFNTGNVISITAATIIDAGSHFLMAEAAGIKVSQNGYFTAEGTASEPITFEGEVSSNGYWRGIEIASNNANNIFHDVVIKHAGNTYLTCCLDLSSLIFKEGQASILNTTISDGAGYGLHIYKDFRVLDYQNIRISNHDNYPLVTSIETLNELDGQGSDYSGNFSDYILVEKSTMDIPVTIEDANVPYRFDDVITVESNLTIEEGTTIEFLADAGVIVAASGSLNAIGTPGNEISFLPSASGSAGFWKGLYFNSNNIDNRLEYIELKGAGSNYLKCCHEKTAIRVDNATLFIGNTDIANVTGCGISHTASANVTIEDVTYSNVTTEVCN